MAEQFFNQGRAQGNFKGLFRPEENESQDNLTHDRRLISAGGTSPISYETPMMDLYKNNLEEMPNQDNYHPSKVSKILAGIAGFASGDPTSAYKTTKGIIDEPYESDLGRWKQKIGQTGELAGLEEKTNASKSKNFYDWAKYEGDSKNDESLRHYRGVEEENLRDQMATRGREKVTNKLTGETNFIDRSGKKLFGFRTDETPGEEDNRKLSFLNNELELRAPYEKLLDDYRTGNQRSLFAPRTNELIREHRENRNFDIANPEAKNELITDQNTGHQGILNVNDPTAVTRDIGKTRETPEDKLQRAQTLATLKHELEQDNIKLKDELSKLSPTQQNAAYDGAVKQVIIENPEYSQFFDSNGNIDLKTIQKFPDVYNTFKSMISGKLSDKTSRDKLIGARPKVGNPLGARGSSTPKLSPDDEARKALEDTKPKDGSYQGSDGSTWIVKNGKATKVEGTK